MMLSVDYHGSCYYFNFLIILHFSISLFMIFSYCCYFIFCWTPNYKNCTHTRTRVVLYDVFSPHSAAWLWNQCGHVMSSLIITMTSLKSDLPPAHSLPCRDWKLHDSSSSSTLGATLGAEFDLSSLKTSLIRVGHSCTGHHQARLHMKEANFHRKTVVPTGVCVASSRGSGCLLWVSQGLGECCTMTDSALHASVQICRNFSAVLFLRIQRKVLVFARWQLDRPAPSLEASNQVSASL